MNRERAMLRPGGIHVTGPYPSIWLATDLEEHAVPPYLHALAMGARLLSKVTLLNVHRGHPGDWDVLPDAAETLTRWGLLDEGDDLINVGMQLERLTPEAGNERLMLADDVEAHRPDLLVMGHRTSSVFTPWRMFEGSTARRLAHRAEGSTLIVPDDNPGFIDAESGAFTLKRVLVPLGAEHTGRGLRHVMRLIDGVGLKDVELILGHMDANPPRIAVPDRFRSHIRTIDAGPVPEQLVEVAAAENVDLVALETHGHLGWRDVVTGQRTDQVMRACQVPVLVCREG